MDNKQLVQQIFERMAEGDTRALVDALADDCRWTFPGSWSWAGTWEPKQVVMDELLTPLVAQFADRYRSEADFVLADGDRVVVQARGRVTTKRGDEYRQTYCYVFRVADGRITEVIEHCDTALVERVLEPPRALVRR
jgi:ketosteroid isomerase-like protein